MELGKYIIEVGAGKEDWVYFNVEFPGYIETESWKLPLVKLGGTVNWLFSTRYDSQEGFKNPFGDHNPLNVYHSTYPRSRQH